MKILQSKQVREADRYTMDNEPILSVNLMERAAGRCSEKITELYDFRNPVYVFAGPGNNGGDGLVIARKLYEKGYETSVFIIQLSDNFSEDFKINLSRLKHYPEIDISYIKAPEDMPDALPEGLITDAIFGSGLTRPAEGFAKQVIEKINAYNLPVVAVDTPSGLQAEENPDEITAVKADHTLTFEFPFLSFFFPENADFVGEFHIINIGLSPVFIEKADTDFYMTESHDILPLIKQRRKFSHKGSFGHALLFAGSYGKAGAALLAAEAAYRSGAGLVSVAVPTANYQILQIALPEAMLQIDTEDKHLKELPDLNPFTASAIGPGIGFHTDTKALLHNLLNSSDTGVVLDADALTILAESPEMLKAVPAGSILTPHLKEFERIVGKQANHYDRLKEQKALAKKLDSVVILKGAHTSVCTPDERCFFNTTGNPGMATGGSGDVLTGMILGMKAQGYTSENAALLGVYLHGAAGDRAAEKMDMQSMIAGDIIDNIRFVL